MRPSECAAHLARALGAPVADDSFVVASGERRARVTVDSNSGTIHAVVVTAYGPKLPEVRLTRESSFDRLGKATRIAREAQLDDPEFDRRVYVDSTLDPGQLRWLFAAPAARETILRLLATCDSIELGEEGLVSRTLNEETFVADAAVLREHLERLFALHAALPAQAPRLRDAQPASGTSPLAYVLIGALLFACLFTTMLLEIGSAGLFSPYRASAIGLGGGVLVWLVLATIAALAFSGRSSSFARFTGFAIASLVVLATAGPLVLVGLNARLDTSPLLEHRVPIRRASMELGDDAPQLYLEFEAPTEPGVIVKLGFDGAAVPPPGTVVHLKTRAGALGFSYRVEAWYGP